MASGDEFALNHRQFTRLFELDGLVELDQEFLQSVKNKDPSLYQRTIDYRNSKISLSPIEESHLLLELSLYLNNFIGQLFKIEDALNKSAKNTLSNDVILDFKKEWVLKRGRRYRQPITLSFSALDSWLTNQLTKVGSAFSDRELRVAQFAQNLLANEETNEEAILSFTQWCVLALSDLEGQKAVSGWTSFHLPQKTDHARLVVLNHEKQGNLERLQADPKTFRQRDGFTLTDQGMSTREVQGEVHYCVYCHEHGGDYCSKGFPEKKDQPELGFKTDSLGVTLTGCPVEEKISEMHTLKRDGYTISALAMAMVDNPMVPATGHRICNDCMKACIYQKQDPVNIPQIETRVLTDVLNLPWGVEIYDLLTRWNPLRHQQFLPKPYQGYKVLVAGMGPAGFTMAHHLTMEGCAVTGIDGLKIEPLPEKFIKEPVRHWSDLQESLDDRILLGFGGVSEYGITVRWNKNFLKLIYLSLLRRSLFQVFGGVRFGGTIKLENAWELGYDHVCIATGAGLPRTISMGNSLARGMRQASDFLMALQLTGAGKKSSLANLQVRLPAVVIGGGLTAIDTATEIQVYYLRQVEKTLDRYEKMVAEQGEEKVRSGLNQEDLEILEEFLNHGRMVKKERERATQAGENPGFISLIQNWGGVTIAYRKGLNASPAYQRNHEEVIKAMEEGLYYAEGLEPLRVELDQYHHVKTLVCRRMKQEEGRWLGTPGEITLPTRAVFIAAGTLPNTIYEHEHSGNLKLEADHFLPYVEHPEGLQPVQVADHCKSPEFGPFTSYDDQQHKVTFVGDTHPVFHGSVVKAIASSKRSYPHIMNALRLLHKSDQGDNYPYFQEKIADLLTPQITEINKNNPSVVEVWVRAPLAAKNFRPGQFFRLQSYETNSPEVDGTKMQIPLLTVSGTGVREDQIRLMVLQWGTGPRLVGKLKPGDPIVLMGPTGAPTEIPADETVLVITGRWGAAVMLDVGPALKAAGNRVIYIASFSSASDLDRQDELEESADQVIWCTNKEPKITPRRSQDISIVQSDIVSLLKHYHESKSSPFSLGKVNRLLIMGSTSLLLGLQTALKDILKTAFHPDVKAIGMVGSPMQCMLKGVCGQCLQWQIDPETGKRTRAVFSCAEQDQPLAWIDLDNLVARQIQNRLPDQMSAKWFDYICSKENNA
ncbi:FAD-dependent oxidoreductase [Candidatus Nitrosacidococcus sp. I8]|uniref:FAD-dependent oxidoreductase n=1 Tax=Candidatus Nitrosacidococcus sp. I8 TaxID=2942908 RepID=UPI002228066E|nr:FAD-dependent oxidoreductase [Candidatus Nitrosacidococcus sp. I8]CAH9018063.1 Dihydroorotate dehydrogenase B (NAD(+)), electron transfer subunit [Candidatus Nitrosacidococcus sp. I8]